VTKILFHWSQVKKLHNEKSDSREGQGFESFLERKGTSDISSI